MAVGATDPASGNDDKETQLVPAWSATGDGSRNPETVTAGRSIASYRVPGSTIDSTVPSARYGNDLFVGSGTSQAAAVTSGLAAIYIGNHPSATPDQLKYRLQSRAVDLEYVATVKEGHGLIDGDTLRKPPKPNTPVQSFPTADGPGSGIVAPTGSTWSGGAWSGSTWSGSTWSGSTWSGGVWSGSTWSGSTWSGSTWSGSTWSGSTWSGSTWSGSTWSGSTWSGSTWSGSTWSGNGWS
jgi:serine protease AprX